MTGVAGLVTALVGLLTVGVQLGWWGSGDGGNGGTSSTTAPAASFTVTPSQVTFDLLRQADQVVTVKNTGQAAAFMWRDVSIQGPGQAAFTLQGSCGSSLEPGRTCDILVRFTPPRSGDYSARLVFRRQPAPRPRSR